MLKENQKEHRRRKNPTAREAWLKRKHAANAARPKQSKIITDTGVIPFRDFVLSKFTIEV